MPKKKPKYKDVCDWIISEEGQKALEEGQENVRARCEQLRKAAKPTWEMWYKPFDDPKSS